MVSVTDLLEKTYRQIAAVARPENKLVDAPEDKLEVGHDNLVVVFDVVVRIDGVGAATKQSAYFCVIWFSFDVSIRVSKVVCGYEDRGPLRSQTNCSCPFS